MAINKTKVLELLHAGWELGCTTAINGKTRILVQDGGIGKGGQAEEVNTSSFTSLLNSKRIIKLGKKSNDPWYLTRYGLNNEKTQ